MSDEWSNLTAERFFQCPEAAIADKSSMNQTPHPQLIKILRRWGEGEMPIGLYGKRGTPISFHSLREELAVLLPFAMLDRRKVKTALQSTGWKQSAGNAWVPPRTSPAELESAASVYPRPHKHKHALYGQQEGKCIICRQSTPFNMMEVDHVVPKSKGGTDAEDNLQLLCGPCNRSKGSKSQKEALQARLDSLDAERANLAERIAREGQDTLPLNPAPESLFDSPETSRTDALRGRVRAGGALP